MAARFRPDIEGLRGIAILLVVLFHAGVSIGAGGFVGVDVFFVLSGYFITGMLVREYTEAGRIDLGEFWGRRSLRLLPPLLVVLIATLAAVMTLYAPIDRARIAGTARAVAMYSGNIEFASGGVDYFGSGENPLLHTWSLAVEEQFYFVWPLLFVLLAILWARRASPEFGGSDRLERRPLLMGIAIAGIASLVVSLWLTDTAQPWAFFGMPSRVWEFALGGALAVWSERDPEPTPVGTLLQVCGLLAIAFAVVVYDRATPYPGVAARLPALAAVALIAGGERAPNGEVTRGLSWGVFRWFGRLSYAWYLWHWPLVGIGAVINPQIGVWGKLAWSLGALGLAWLTYLYIERSARDGRLSRIPTRWLAPAALGVSVGAALLAHGAMRNAERTVAGSAAQRAFAAARTDRMEHGCWASTVEDVKGPCLFGDRDGKVTLALLGDSHAEHWLGGLDRAGREHGWRIDAMVKGGCPVADMPTLMRPRLKRYYHECTRYREAMLQRIIAMRPTAVILSSWDHYIPPDGTGADWQVTPAMWQSGLRKTYERLVAAKIPVIAIRGTPRTWFDVPACLSRRAAGVPFASDCTYDRAKAMSAAAIGAQQAAAKGLPVRFVDMNDLICATKRCRVQRNGVIVFTDDNHLTRTFSQSVAGPLGARLSSLLPPAEPAAHNPQ